MHLALQTRRISASCARGELKLAPRAIGLLTSTRASILQRTDSDTLHTTHDAIRVARAAQLPDTRFQSKARRGGESSTSRILSCARLLAVALQRQPHSHGMGARGAGREAPRHWRREALATGGEEGLLRRVAKRACLRHEWRRGPLRHRQEGLFATHTKVAKSPSWRCTDLGAVGSTAS